jgi:hypothetical protein
MKTIDFWEVFQIGRTQYIVGFDHSSFKTLIKEITSINSEKMQITVSDKNTYELGGVQGLNLRTLHSLENWLEISDINKNDVIRNVDIFGEYYERNEKISNT